MQRLCGKIALVTGAARGIGRAVAKALAKEGAFVVINYNKNSEAASQTAEEIKAQGGSAEVWQCDVSDGERCRQMIEKVIERHERLDILVNNAGITRDNLLVRMTEIEFDEVLNANLKGTFHTLRYASRYFIKQRYGRVINIASVSGILGNAGQANYAASKAGMIGLTKTAARELAGRGITVNAVAPGYIKTEMTDAMPQSVKEAVFGRIPMKRMGNPEDVAGAVVFLSLNESSYITGQVLCVDGGMAM